MALSKAYALLSLNSQVSALYPQDIEQESQTHFQMLQIHHGGIFLIE